MAPQKRRRCKHHLAVVHNRRNMVDQALRLINRWLFDVEHKLRNRLDALTDDMRSDDDATAEQAAEEASKILDWLYPTPHPLSNEQQLQRASAVIADDSLSPEQRLAAAKRALRSTRQGRGRPRDETSQLAIRALTLHYATRLSWREIALTVRGCNHKRPNPERSCSPCGESIRQAAIRLQKFLKTLGHDPVVQRGIDLDTASQLELERLWQVEK